MKPHDSNSQHRIRLHGPWWRVAVLADGPLDQREATSPRLTLPFTADQLRSTSSESMGLGPDSRIGLVRPFRVPTGLTAEHRIWLAIESPLDALRVSLDGVQWNWGAKLDWQLSDLIKSHPAQTSLHLGLVIEPAALKTLAANEFVIRTCELRISADATK